MSSRNIKLYYAVILLVWGLFLLLMFGATGHSVADSDFMQRMEVIGYPSFCLAAGVLLLIRFRVMIVHRVLLPVVVGLHVWYWLTVISEPSMGDGQFLFFIWMLGLMAVGGYLIYTAIKNKE